MTRGAYLMNLGRSTTRRRGSSSARWPRPSARARSRTRSSCSSTRRRSRSAGAPTRRAAHPDGTAVELVETDRGGKSTYHGPGQLVCYPILDLNRHGRDVKQYCRNLEQAIIQTVAAFGLEATRIDGLTGVWLDSPPRKIASIGVHISRWVTTTATRSTSTSTRRRSPSGSPPAGSRTRRSRRSRASSAAASGRRGPAAGGRRARRGLRPDARRAPGRRAGLWPQPLHAQLAAR